MCSADCDICSVPTTCETCNVGYGLVESTLSCRQCNTIGEYYSNNACGGKIMRKEGFNSY